MTDVLIDATFRVTVVLAAAGIAAMILRRASADIRFRIWLAALLISAFFLIPMPAPGPFRIEIAAGSPVAGHGSMAMSWNWPIFLVPVWAAGLMLSLARLGTGLVSLVRLTRGAGRFSAGEILVSDVIATPMTWGVLRPVILLPAYVVAWSAEKRNAVVLHERAHIERRDWAWQMFAQAVTALFWFHPLVWLAAACLRHEAERAADDRVLAAGVSPTEYAARLVEVARRLQTYVPNAFIANAAANASMAMVRQPILSARIGAILDRSRSRACAGVLPQATIVAVSTVVFLLLAACQSARIYKVAEVTIPPRVASKIEPQYTPEARAAKLQGTVALTMVIKPDGRADHIRVIRSLDKGLDANAIAAIRQWSFEPGKKDGKSVPVGATIEVNFRLL